MASDEKPRGPTMERRSPYDASVRRLPVTTDDRVKGLARRLGKLEKRVDELVELLNRTDSLGGEG